MVTSLMATFSEYATVSPRERIFACTPSATDNVGAAAMAPILASSSDGIVPGL
jgi:hypothetical protein